jgi:hypothetical protein
MDKEKNDLTRSSLTLRSQISYPSIMRWNLGHFDGEIRSVSAFWYLTMSLFYKNGSIILTFVISLSLKPFEPCCTCTKSINQTLEDFVK